MHKSPGSRTIPMFFKIKDLCILIKQGKLGFIQRALSICFSQCCVWQELWYFDCWSFILTAQVRDEYTEEIVLVPPSFLTQCGGQLQTAVTLILSLQIVNQVYNGICIGANSFHPVSVWWQRHCSVRLCEVQAINKS